MHVVKRTLKPLVLDRAPLIYFLAQVRFGDILAMADHVTAIQDALRRCGYPVFRSALVQALNLDKGFPAVEQREIWNFENVERTRGIVLTRDSVGFQTTNYERYESTMPELIGALSKIHDILDLSALLRCGLRYVNAVHPNAGEEFETYLRPEIMGLSSRIPDVTTVLQSSAFQGQSEAGILMVRFATSQSPQVLPPDLVPNNLPINTTIPSGEPIGTLDIDHFTQIQDLFSVAKAESVLDDLHDACSRAFAACLTPDALSLWGQRNV